MEDQGPDAIAQLNERIGELESRLSDVEADRPAIKREAVVIVLQLLTDSLRHVASAKMKIPDISHVENAGGKDARWEAIKNRLAPRLREAVDILLLQGPMKRTQLAAALKMDYSNCTKNVIAVLLRQGIMVENNRELSLKEL
jgi:hypothetical protein